MKRIVLTVAVLVFGLVGCDYQENATSKSNISFQCNNDTMEQWDGQSVTGSQIISILRLYNDESVCITVNNGNGAIDYIQNATLTGAGADISRATTRTDDGYISPSEIYDCEIKKDANTDTIIGLTFTKR